MRIGLSGGIGSGKSSVAALLAERGAVIVDADAIAREVVAPGTAGLAAVLADFGTDVAAADGSLDRAALAEVVFADEAARQRLERITHPLIWAEAERQFSVVPQDGIVVHDMPLLVEKSMSADYHLVVIVMADQAIRLQRLVQGRGLDRVDALARMHAQATDAQRRAAADVLLENDGSPDDLAEAVRLLWQERIAPMAALLTEGEPAPEAQRITSDAVSLAQTAARTAARVGRALGDPGARLTRITRERTRLILAMTLTGHPGAEAPSSLLRAGFPAIGEHQYGTTDPSCPSRITLDWE